MGTFTGAVLAAGVCSLDAGAFTAEHPNAPRARTAPATRLIVLIGALIFIGVKLAEGEGFEPSPV